MKNDFIVKKKRELADWVGDFARELRGGDLLCLNGELGSGKTTMVRLLARRLGISWKVTSPTFNILRVYEVQPEERTSKGGIRRLYHVDCYRLGRAEELAELGLEEWLADREGLVVIEWAKKVADLLPPPRIDVNLEIRGEKTRRITCEDKRL